MDQFTKKFKPMSNTFSVGKGQSVIWVVYCSIKSANIYFVTTNTDNNSDHIVHIFQKVSRKADKIKYAEHTDVLQTSMSCS